MTFKKCRISRDLWSMLVPPVGSGLAGWLPEEPIVYGTNRDQRGYHAHAFSQVWARFRLDDQDDEVAERALSEEQAEDTEETCVRALLRNGALGGGLGRKGKR